MKNTTQSIYQESFLFEIEQISSNLKAIFYTRKLSLQGKKNHDALGFVEIGETKYFAVCDGMGGLPFSQQASQLIISELFESLKKNGVNDSVFSASEILKESFPGAGSTLSLMALSQGMLTVYNVGDSPVIMINAKTKRITFKSQSHDSYSLIEEGLGEEITRADKVLDLEDKSSELTNYLPVENYYLSNYSPMEFTKQDIAIMGSDGFFNAIEDIELLATFSKFPKYNDDQIIEAIDSMKLGSIFKDDSSFIVLFHSKH